MAKAKGGFYIGGDEKPVGCYRYHSGCDDAHTCQNNRCFWRWRDVFGWSVWALFNSDGSVNTSHSDALQVQHGEPFWPDIKCVPGTNVWYMYCRDFIPEPDDG